METNGDVSENPQTPTALQGASNGRPSMEEWKKALEKRLTSKKDAEQAKLALLTKSAGKPNAAQAEEQGKGSKRPWKDGRQNQGNKRGKYVRPVTVRYEKDVGITQYLSPGQAFTAIIKQRCADFVVREIDQEGNIARITDQTPIEPEGLVGQAELSGELEVELVPLEIWDRLEKLANDEITEDVSLDVTEMDKKNRFKVHKMFLCLHDDFVSSTVEKDGKKFITVNKTTRVGKDVRDTPYRPWPRRAPRYTKFVLYKDNKDTMHAINALAGKLKVKPEMIGYAGTKDRRAKTSQFITVPKVLPEKLLQSIERSCMVGNFSFVNRPLKLGQLRGNRFEIVLRSVDGNEEEIKQSLTNLKDVGFINYFGMQRFGTQSVATHDIGKALLLNKLEKVVDMILSISEEEKNDDAVSKAKKCYAQTKDARKALNMLSGKAYFSLEGKLLQGLAKHETNLNAALDCLPVNMRKMYLHAYQSFVWNTVVSKRIAEYGAKPVVGDLVFEDSKEPWDDSSDLDVDKEAGDDEEKVETMEGVPEEEEKKLRFATPIRLTEENLDNYRLEDIVMPLPGFDVIYPSHDAEKWYAECMEQHSIVAETFRCKNKTYELSGNYRRMIVKPVDFEHTFVRYDDFTKSLVPSDEDVMKNVPPAEDIEGGKHLALVLGFSLPSSSYATMALRELTRTETSSFFQAQLTQDEAKKEVVDT